MRGRSRGAPGFSWGHRRLAPNPPAEFRSITHEDAAAIRADPKCSLRESIDATKLIVRRCDFGRFGRSQSIKRRRWSCHEEWFGRVVEDMPRRRHGYPADMPLTPSTTMFRLALAWFIAERLACQAVRSALECVRARRRQDEAYAIVSAVMAFQA